MSPSYAPVPEVHIHNLRVKDKFQGLSEKEKLYAHYMARAAWQGTRIILRQVSPEAIGIFDFILELYTDCGGDWAILVRDNSVDREQLNAFLLYAASFLSNVGNYYGSGDQKFVPGVEPEFLEVASSRSARLKTLYGKIAVPLFSVPPFSLGYPSDSAQSSYYPGTDATRMTPEEIAEVSKTLESHGIWPENTRIKKILTPENLTYEVLQASVETDAGGQLFKLPSSHASIHLKRGDHSVELTNICDSLSNAALYAANETQKTFLRKYIESFQTGNLDSYRESLRAWVTDKGARVENIFGFVEPYRDPCGIRAEFEGLVGIADAEETRLLTKLVQASDIFIKRLPWVQADHEGKGPFEKQLFEPPDLSCLHVLAYCSSIIFPGINLPNVIIKSSGPLAFTNGQQYNDIREECGFKNVIITNRMIAEGSPKRVSRFVNGAEAVLFQKYKYDAYYWWVVLHELLGHGTGKLLVEEANNKFNFDVKVPPIDPLTGKPINSWYKPGETWTGQFSDLSTSLDECRAELVGAYLMDDRELLALFGFTDETELTASKMTYNVYMQLGTDGLRGLANFNVEDGKWGQAHSRAHFAILRCLLRDGGGVITVESDPQRKKVTVKLDESKILSHGKPALGDMLLRLHIYRCTAQVEQCRSYYEELTRVDGEYLEWRDIVITNKLPQLLYVQPNSFIQDDLITIKEYDATCEGIIKSWAERSV